MHLVLALEGRLGVRTSAGREWTEAAGVLTAPDASHAIDATGQEVMLVFFEAESAVGAALSQVLPGPLRALSDRERDELTRDADPRAILHAHGADWSRRVVETLGAPALPASRAIHPRVKRLLRLLRSSGSAATSLDALADQIGLSPGRLMHVFTESIGIPLRPYLAWLKLQRAAAAIVGGMPLAAAASAAGFSDAGHMSRTFRHMFGVTPSELRPKN
jgi:transcriptional regulator GlxA family with amidase domain